MRRASKQCACRERLTNTELVSLLQTVRVGGLLLTGAEADCVMRRIRMAEAQKNLKE
jgi:ABC-type enterobactin transport system permease subunit